MTSSLSKALLLAAALETVQASYCTIYSDAACTNQHRSVSYEAGDLHCSQNAGQYIKCESFLHYGLELYDSGDCSIPTQYFGFSGYDCISLSGFSSRNLNWKLKVGGTGAGIIAQGPVARRGTSHAADRGRMDEIRAPLESREDIPSGSQGSPADDSSSEGSSCTGHIEFYYGGKCIGPASKYEEYVQAATDDNTAWASKCHKDGLFGQYILKASLCDLYIYEGADCDGKKHFVSTGAEQNKCKPVNLEDGVRYTMRSWKWACNENACSA